jgi:methylated-DNA-protein-cysteine methyltransferase related protein
MQPQVKIRADVLDVIRRVPAGRVATHGQIGAEMGIAPAHIAAVMAVLTDDERSTAPWWRVVADGGAIGRHAGRDIQIQKLRAEGLLVAPVGIVQEMAQRRVASLAPVPPGRATPEATPKEPARSLSRGMKGRPTSTV